MDSDIVAFDDTYEHSVANNTNRSRIVLFLDIDRRMKYTWAQTILKCVSYLIGTTIPQQVNTNIASDDSSAPFVRCGG